MDKQTVQSNEQIIESTAKDFEKSLKFCDDNDTHDQMFSSGSTFNKCDENMKEAKDQQRTLDDNSDQDNLSEKSESEDEIEFDEEYLKEQAKNMSEIEIQKAKDEAKELKENGNRYFKDENYREAISTYTKALNICPLSFSEERSILFSNRAACRVRLDAKETAVLDCNKALELNPNYLKALMRRAQLYRNLEKLDEALTDYQKILQIDPSIGEARQACVELPEEIKERNEKLKTEMLGKLKDLGNMVLRPFGLSTDNFNLVQDPNTGGYSINFQNNHN